jgi:hypothetical protein
MWRRSYSDLDNTGRILMGYQGTMHTYDDCLKSLPPAGKDFYEQRAVFSCDECGKTYRVYRFVDSGPGLFGRAEKVSWLWELYDGYINLSLDY